MKFQAFIGYIIPFAWTTLPFFKWLTYRKTHNTRVVIWEKEVVRPEEMCHCQVCKGQRPGLRGHG
jgi:hypothetical protein